MFQEYSSFTLTLQSKTEHCNGTPNILCAFQDNESAIKQHYEFFVHFFACFLFRETKIFFFCVSYFTPQLLSHNLSLNVDIFLRILLNHPNIHQYETKCYICHKFLIFDQTCKQNIKLLIPSENVFVEGSMF